MDIEARIAATPAHPDTVEVLAGLIAELDEATESGLFYDHVCEAACRLTSMERAGLLLYDPATHAVNAVGSHGMDKALISEVEGTLEETPIAQRALAEDRVVHASEHLERELPARYAQFAGITTIVCGPVAAGGRWLGVIFADRGGGRFEPSDEERQTILTLGRLAALAASVERATRQDERARRLSERIELTREIHERVMQRLFGLVLALGSGEPLTAAERQTCHDQLQSVIGELRSALGRPAGEAAAPRTTLAELVGRRAERTPEMVVSWPESVAVPPRLERLAQSVFVEALRNCEKHADPRRIEVRVAAPSDAFELEVTNDGISDDGGPGTSLGLRLLTLEALQQDALVEFGALPDGRWHVRMVGSRE
jgi:signal transduction histidine kinase